jgi:hypothetical protein
MTEIAALLGIYGAVDQVAQTDPDLRAAVSQLLPLYADPELHWYDDFQAWLGGSEAEAAETLFPPVTDALKELAKIEPSCRMRPRRLFAIAVAMRAFPEMREPHSPLGTLAVSALRVSSLAGEAEHALALHELLAEERLLPDLNPSSEELSTWWSGLVTAAASDSLIPSKTGMFPRPCSGRLVSVPDLAGPVAALETEFETDEVDFDRATRFIQPSNWKKCMPWFWCEMKQLKVATPPGVYRYREVVSSADCDDKATAAFRAETELDFSFLWLPDKADPQVAVANYQMAPGRPLPGDLIRVDEGSLVVAKVGAGPTPLRITTTKRIQFSYPFSSQALAMIMCALGYTEVAGNLLCCAASNPKQTGSRFPGEAPGTVQHGPVPVPVPAPVPGGVPVAVGECIEECAAAAADWSKRVSQGPYNSDELAQDMAEAWVRVLRKGATAFEMGATGTQTATRTRPRDRKEK